MSTNESQYIFINTLSLAPIKANPHAYPFSIVTMDFITNLLESNRYNVLYIVVDHNLIKAIVLILCTKTIDTIGTARLYHNNVYQRFGLPNRIILDRGPQFSLQVFQKINKWLGVISSMSTAFYLQTNG